MKPSIRHLQPEDHKAVHDLFSEQEVINGTMRLPYAPLEYTRKRLESQDGVINLVACVNDEVAGYAELITYPNVPRHRHVGEVNMIAVRRDLHDMGIGRALMQAMIDLADNWLQLKRLGLLVWTFNESAIHLYKKCGFEIEGKLPQYAFGHGDYIDAYLMGRITTIAKQKGEPYNVHTLNSEKPQAKPVQN